MHATMKKSYIQPEILVVNMGLHTIIAASNYTVNTSAATDYDEGGDISGTKEISSHTYGL